MFIHWSTIARYSHIYTHWVGNILSANTIRKIEYNFDKSALINCNPLYLYMFRSNVYIFLIFYSFYFCLRLYKSKYTFSWNIFFFCLYIYDNHCVVAAANVNWMFLWQHYDFMTNTTDGITCLHCIFCFIYIYILLKKIFKKHFCIK